MFGVDLEICGVFRGIFAVDLGVNAADLGKNAAFRNIYTAYYIENPMIM